MAVGFRWRWRGPSAAVRGCLCHLLPLAWMVRTALRAKKGPARGSIEICLPPLASRENETDIPLVRAPLPAPSKKFLSPAVRLEGPMPVVPLRFLKIFRGPGQKIWRRTEPRVLNRVPSLAACRRASPP